MVKNTDVEMKEAPSQTKNKKTDPKIEDVAMDEGEAEEPKKDPDLLTLEGYFYILILSMYAYFTVLVGSDRKIIYIILHCFFYNHNF